MNPLLNYVATLHHILCVIIFDVNKNTCFPFLFCFGWQLNQNWRLFKERARETHFCSMTITQHYHDKNTRTKEDKKRGKKRKNDKHEIFTKHEHYLTRHATHSASRLTNLRFPQITFTNTINCSSKQRETYVNFCLSVSFVQQLSMVRTRQDEKRLVSRKKKDTFKEKKVRKKM